LKRLLLLAGIAIAATGPLVAAPNDGLADAQAGGFMATLRSYTASIGAGVSGALDSITPSAEGSLGTFEALIGDAYYYGHGVSRDYTEAARWYRRAAENSNAMAQSAISLAFDRGYASHLPHAKAQILAVFWGAAAALAWGLSVAGTLLWTDLGIFSSVRWNSFCNFFAAGFAAATAGYSAH